VYLIYLLRAPLLEFLDSALSRDRSVTLHEFMARQHGNDPRVRLLAASLTLCAFLALLVGEALAVAALLEPMLPEGAATAYLFAIGAGLLMMLHAVPAGHSGAVHSAQLQLGMLYLGLFGSTALVLYLHASARTPMPPHGTLAVVLVAACSAIVLGYRRSRYVDTDPIRSATSDSAPHKGWACARLLSRFGKILNPLLSLLLVAIIVVALMELSAAGLPTLLRDSDAALRAGTRVPGVGLIALCLLPLFYPLVDVTNWQRLAAIRKDVISGVEAGRRSAALRRVFRTCAVESSILALFVCMLGAIAVAAAEAPSGANVLQAFVARLTAEDNGVSGVAAPLLLICVVAAALSTMSALFSASLCTIRYDMVAPGQGRAADEATATRRTLVAGGGLALACAAAFVVAGASLPISFTTGTFVALLSAICCAQLSFAPLVLGPIVARRRGGSGAVSPGWAFIILAAGAASGVVAVIVYLATGIEAWLWAAVPVCLGSGTLLFAIARAASRDAA
jgi:hypothetical protein